MDPVLSRKERERETRRQAILSSARSVISEKGYTNATLDEIAAKAEFGKGTLYNYFEGGKEEILFTIIDEMYAEVQNVMTQVLESSESESARDVLKRLIQELLQYYSDNVDTFMILVKEVQRLLIAGNDKSYYFIDKRNMLIETMVNPLQRYIDDKKIRDLPARAIAHMLLGNIHGCQMQAFLEQSNDCSLPLSSEKNAEFLSVMLLDGLLMSSPDSNNK